MNVEMDLSRIEGSMAADRVPFQLPRGVLLAGFSVAILGGCVDHYISIVPIRELHRYFCYLWLVILFVADDFVRWRMRLAFGLAAVGLLAGVSDFLSSNPEITSSGHVDAAFSLAFFGLGIWHFGGLHEQLGRSRADYRLRFVLLVLVVYMGWQFITCSTSYYPDISYAAYLEERAFLMPIIFAWVRAAVADEHFRFRTGKIVAWFFAILVAAAALILLAEWIGGKGVREFLVRYQMIYAEPSQLEGMPRRRLLFPTIHFNRTAFFVVVAMGVFAIARLQSKDRRIRNGLLVLIGLCWVELFFTYTRTLVLAAGFGVAIWALLDRRWRLIGALCAAALVLLVLMPANTRQHFLSAFNRKTYQTDEGPTTSMRLRFWAWEWGEDRIDDKPLTGLGFSTEVTERRYQRHIERGAPEDKRRAYESGGQIDHVHNLWLETGVESGLPAVAALFLFFVVRWLMLLSAFFHGGSNQQATRSKMAVYLALEAALMVGMMLFYTLRRNFGFIFFYLWVWMLLEAWQCRDTSSPGA